MELRSKSVYILDELRLVQGRIDLRGNRENGD